MFAIREFHYLCHRYLSCSCGNVWMRVTTLENARSKWRKQPLPKLRALVAEHVLSRRIAALEETESFSDVAPEACVHVREDGSY
jgi:hypothetical protein